MYAARLRSVAQRHASLDQCRSYRRAPHRPLPNILCALPPPGVTPPRPFHTTSAYSHHLRYFFMPRCPPASVDGGNTCKTKDGPRALPPNPGVGPCSSGGCRVAKRRVERVRVGVCVRAWLCSGGRGRRTSPRAAAASAHACACASSVGGRMPRPPPPSRLAVVLPPSDGQRFRRWRAAALRPFTPPPPLHTA
jgi:hypothetical protein